MKMEECSETSAYKIQTPENYPQGNIQNTAKVWNQETQDIPLVKFSTETKHQKGTRRISRYDTVFLNNQSIITKHGTKLQRFTLYEGLWV
jgi:Mlc titration factor MtfA (ptsG expression regulator)